MGPTPLTAARDRLRALVLADRALTAPELAEVPRLAALVRLEGTTRDHR